ncbi:hypothetical protein Fmac_021030 [Flemingia macrophylla]|uniref:Uncharacterized protein n=1 Tax=Flemingia macrophylla TaxID=520843 RepID=A0ABD1LW75_9FABA
MIHEHAFCMAQELGRAVHVDEVFHQTHVRKTTGDFVDQRSKKTYEEFESIYSQARSKAASYGGGSQLSPMDPVQEERIRKHSWFTAAGGKNSKGRLYGVGKVSQGYRLGDTLQEPGYGVPNSVKIIQLEEEVHQSREEARKSRRRLAKPGRRMSD